jgi:hypothetical protein
VLHFAYPVAIDAAACEQLAEDTAAAISALTGREVVAQPVPYSRVDDAIDRLHAAGSGVALVILNDEPAAYHEVSYHLPRWRVKRVTEQVLLDHYEKLRRGVWDRRTQSYNRHRGKGRWQQFVRLITLDLLQLVDVIPFRLADPGPYEAQIAIDVGHDRRHVTLSVLIARDDPACPAFKFVTQTHRKPDTKHEAINPRLLQDHLVTLLQDTLGSNGTPLRSLLVMRDGRLWEGQAIDQGVTTLRMSGCIATDARVDIVELHKDSLKNLRIWEVDEQGNVKNPLEGTLVLLDPKTALVTTTGVATLHQGTAEPLLLIANGRCSSVLDAGRATVAGSQLNWSSPGMCQRLPLPLKRSDEELTARAAQEIRRIV